MQRQHQHTARRSASSARRFLKRNVAIALAVTATAAVLGAATSASAWTGHSAGHSYRGSVVTDVRTAANFDFAAGEIPENITVNPDGSVTLSLLGSCAVCERTHGPELMRISASGERTVLVTGQVGEAISGNTRGGDGTV